MGEFREIVSECGNEAEGRTYLESTDHHEILVAGVVSHGDDSEWNRGSAQSLERGTRDMTTWRIKVCQALE